MLENPGNFCERKFCSRDDGPSALEVTASLGVPLGQVVFDYSHAEVRRLLGLPTSEKIPCNFAFSPADELRGNDSLPLLTETDCLKANVHNDILELGKELLEQYRLEIQQKAAKSIQCHMKDIFHTYQAKKRDENELNIRELHEHYEKYIRIVQRELEKKIENEWEKVIEKLGKRLRKCSTNERMKQRREFLKTMRSEIQYIISHLYSDFEHHFRAQKEKIISDFNGIIRKEHIKLNDTVRNLEEKHAQKMRFKRQELQMQNTADILHLLCAERSGSNAKGQAIKKETEKEINELENTITQLNETVLAMKTELAQLREEKEVVQGQLAECSKEFKKFVCFVFHTNPDQAEYLLSTEEV